MTTEEVADVLDEAMHEGTTLRITTKERGVFVGEPHNVDEFDTDPDRLGYVVMLSKHFCDTVFLDEVVSIEPVKA